jgi:hypothetical protein
MQITRCQYIIFMLNNYQLILQSNEYRGSFLWIKSQDPQVDHSAQWLQSLRFLAICLHASLRILGGVLDAETMLHFKHFIGRNCFNDMSP